MSPAEEGDPRADVRAAGGVVWRAGPDGAVEVLLVHRERYDDWTLPKGKRDPGETDAECARREVEEETGMRCRLGAELPSTTYVDHRGRSKRVRYWAMEVESGTFAPNDEVDEVRWVPLRAAAELLTYRRDHTVIDALAEGSDAPRA
ncbi:MAG: hydrolase [Acidimicrobiales bacterium]|nr:hydrolase [Acidimicrobiales bacterium]